jgi:hypothetical protein
MRKLWTGKRCIKSVKDHRRRLKKIEENAEELPNRQVANVHIMLRSVQSEGQVRLLTGFSSCPNKLSKINTSELLINQGGRKLLKMRKSAESEVSVLSGSLF